MFCLGATSQKKPWPGAGQELPGAGQELPGAARSCQERKKPEKSLKINRLTFVINIFFTIFIKIIVSTKTQLKMEHLENFHIIEVQYLAPTNFTGSRVKLISFRFDQSIKIPFDYELNNVCDIAQAYLENAGFSFIGKAESKNGYFLISTTFKPLKK